MKVYIVGALALVTFLLFIGMVMANPQSTKYEPTETETLRLQLAQAHGQLAQQQFQYAQQTLAKATEDFNKTGQDIIKAHKWPDDLRLDPNTLVFSEAPKPAPGPVPAK